MSNDQWDILLTERILNIEINVFFVEVSEIDRRVLDFPHSTETGWQQFCVHLAEVLLSSSNC